MLWRIIKRIIYAFFTLLISASITFYLVYNIPGNVIDVMAAQLSESMGIPFEEAKKIALSYYIGYDPNKPLLERYIDYLANLLRGNLGYSILLKVSVNEVVVQALPWTLFVLSTSLLVSFAIGVMLGLIIAWRRRTVLEPVVTAYASFTDAMPDFVTAMLLYMFLAVRLGWFPMKGAYDEKLTPGLYPAFIFSVLYHATLPILAYVIEHIGFWALLMKGSAASVLEEDFVKAAEARGLPERRILTAYVGRVAILPVAVMLAIQLGVMLGGSTIIETVFNYPGMGYFFTYATTNLDYGLMQGLFFVIIAGIIIANLIVEIIYPFIDPRARREAAR